MGDNIFGFCCDVCRLLLLVFVDALGIGDLIATSHRIAHVGTFRIRLDSQFHSSFYLHFSVIPQNEIQSEKTLFDF